MNNESELQPTSTEEGENPQELLSRHEIQESEAASSTSQPPPSRSRGKHLQGTSSRPDLMKAHVALMEREVLLPKHGDLFRLVQYHYRKLQAWHDQFTGWRIQRGSTVIRLVRQPSATTPGYLYERLKDPKDFACLTWLLWFAENRQLSGRGNDQQFLLSQLAEQIKEQSSQGADAEAGFDFRRQADRYNIQRALQYLEDLGGLQLVDGQTREWIEQAPNADVLYEFTDVIRSLVAALNPQLVDMVAERLSDTATVLRPTLLAGTIDEDVVTSNRTEGLAPPRGAATFHTVPAQGMVGLAPTQGNVVAPLGGARSVGARSMGVSPLVRAWRSLLLGPALVRFDDPAAFAALIEHADEVANELLATFSWLLDIRRDYACIVRASGMAGGPITPMTLFGASDQIAMLLCKAMRGQVEAGAWPAPDAYGCLHVTTEDIAELFYSLRELYGENWGSDARGKGARSLLNDVYRKMRQVGLLRGPDELGNLLILPTAARYSATYDRAETAAPSRNRSRTSAKNTREPIAAGSDSLWSSSADKA